MTKENSTYTGFTEARARANKKYISQFAEVKIRMAPARRDEVRDHASRMGESMNAFLSRAISETMERDKLENPSTFATKP